MMVNEPGHAAAVALTQLTESLAKLVSQRDLWQQRYRDAVGERDAARAELDDNRWRWQQMSP